MQKKSLFLILALILSMSVFAIDADKITGKNGKTFLEVVKETGGIEVNLGFAGDENHYIGGKGDKVWYYIDINGECEYWVGTYSKGKWSDVHYTQIDESIMAQDVAAGKTISKIAERIYFYQKELIESKRKPSATKYQNYACEHYSFNFGEKAYDILADFGFTVGFSDCNDNSTSYRLMGVSVGEDVECPSEN